MSNYKEYQKYVESYNWKKKAKTFSETQHFCSVCKIFGKDHKIRHIRLDNLGNETENDIVVLCKDCYKTILNQLMEHEGFHGFLHGLKVLKGLFRKFDGHRGLSYEAASSYRSDKLDQAIEKYKKDPNPHLKNILIAQVLKLPV